MNGWNRCNVCGRYIGLDDFMGDPPKAVNTLTNPSAHGSEEVWDTYHTACNESPTEGGDDA